MCLTGSKKKSSQHDVLLTLDIIRLQELSGYIKISIKILLENFYERQILCRFRRETLTSPKEGSLLENTPNKTC